MLLRNIVGRLAFISAFSTMSLQAKEFNVRQFGATGDGKTLDTAAINRAIDAAALAGGGTVRFPAGDYLSFSIRLKSHITLQLDEGSTIVAGTPADNFGAYDEAEPNPWGDEHQYQDFGHSHWHNSLIWGEDLEEISIGGPGRIYGKGLVRAANWGGTWHNETAFGPNNTPPPGTRPSPTPSNGARTSRGVGNKAIALKNCRHVTLRDFSLLLGGHFALLATGVDKLTIENVKVDTNRDGLDIDSCRDVRIANSIVNAPNDDAIVFKASFALGEARACENITVTNCAVSGFDAGTVLDGTRGKTMAHAPDRDGPTGRIKFGTESNGAFRNVKISDCTFERSRGLAFESVDGSIIEDVTVENIKMREINNAPIFLRLGNRARGPSDTKVGAIRRVQIRNIDARDVDARYPILLVGLPGHPLENITLENIVIESHGGISQEQAAAQPAELINGFFLRDPALRQPRDAFAVPEQEKAYPEPSMFGLLPAGGIYARHLQNLAVKNYALRIQKVDTRAVMVLEDVAHARISDIGLPDAASGRNFILRQVQDFTMHNILGLKDASRSSAADEKF